MTISNILKADKGIASTTHFTELSTTLDIIKPSIMKDAITKHQRYVDQSLDGAQYIINSNSVYTDIVNNISTIINDQLANTKTPYTFILDDASQTPYVRALLKTDIPPTNYYHNLLVIEDNTSNTQHTHSYILGVINYIKIADDLSSDIPQEVWMLYITTYTGENVISPNDIPITYLVRQYGIDYMITNNTHSRKTEHRPDELTPDIGF